MTSASPDITVQPGKCWWCGARADSREHRLKASDLRREYGKPPYDDLRTLARFSGDQRSEFRGPNSSLVKFSKTLCARCNDTTSQPFDSAWDTFAAYVADHEADILITRQLDWAEVFGPDWKARGADFERYVLKHAMCRVIDQLSHPIEVAGEYIDFLNGGPRPNVMAIGLAIDLSVVALLRVTRESPPPEQPEAADAGFLGMTDLWVQGSQSGKWAQPQAAVVYRYMAVFWKLGHETSSPFDNQQITLDTTDAMFGPRVRRMLGTGPLAATYRFAWRLRSGWRR